MGFESSENMLDISVSAWPSPPNVDTRALGVSIWRATGFVRKYVNVLNENTNNSI